jgi:hypothetical protein
VKLGHVSGFLLGSWIFVPAVVHAFDLLEQEQHQHAQQLAAILPTSK